MQKIPLAALAALAGFSIASPGADSFLASDPAIAAESVSAAAGRVARSARPTIAADGRVATTEEHQVPTVSMRPTIVVHGASMEEQVRVDEARARFSGAGLALPDLEVVFAGDPSGCDGHDGLFRSGVTPWQVVVCSDLAFVLTHEFAHAWEAANLDDEDRARYTERRGLATWNSDDVGWAERGVEDLAFMVQQNLMAGDVSPSSARWVERTDAYGWATGRPSPVSVPADCPSQLRTSHHE